MTAAKKNWEITLCPMGNIHVHYQAAFADVLQHGLHAVADELRELADNLTLLEAHSGATGTRAAALKGGQRF
jgi:hypothetical protein